MRKKVDSRVRGVVEEAVKKQHRAMFVIVGDNGRDQVVNLHYMVSKMMVKKPSVLWCYKKDLGFSSHKTKRMKQAKKQMVRGVYDPVVDDPFELFVTSTNIRYTYYKDTDKVLGKTFGMCVLQDFEALTPNLLCRTIETVEGGGVIVLLLKTVSSLKQLYSLAMDSHSKFRTEVHTDIEPRFNERFILSLADCGNCLVVDDELNILPLCRTTPQPSESRTVEVTDMKEETPQQIELQELKESMKDTMPIGAILQVAKTLDQARALMQFVDLISEKSLRQTASLTAARGRGKSAGLGLSIAAAIAYGYANIFVTAPSPENVTTLFEFILKGFDALGLKEHQDYELVQAQESEFNQAVVRINVFRDHRQTVQYVDPSDYSVLAQAELLIVDEAAAIPLPTVKKLLGPYLTLLASTVHGYEGTGRSLTLKLVNDLKKGGSGSRSEKEERSLKELELMEPIRYNAGDPIEKWLFKLLCLDCTTASPLRTPVLPMPASCELYWVNRDALFSHHKASERFLHSIMSLFVSSHYKNTPNDLMMMSDAPAHHVFVLCPPIDPEAPVAGLPDVLVVIQVAMEGALSRESVEASLKRGLRPSGDLIPWTMSQNYLDSDFGTLNGARIVRIATHSSLQRKGYASEAIKQLVDWFDNKMGGVVAEQSSSEEEEEVDQKTGLLEEEVKPRKGAALLTKCETVPPPYQLDYFGTSFGVTPELFNFWKKAGFEMSYLRQTPNSVTGEYSSIMLRSLDNRPWHANFCNDFRSRFCRLLGGPFATMNTALSLGITDPPNPKDTVQKVGEMKIQTLEQLLQVFNRHDMERLQKYAEGMVDFALVADLMPAVSALFFERRMPGDIRLSYMQSACLLAVGLQRRTIDALAKEFNVPATQLLALMSKAISKFSSAFTKLLESGVEIGDAKKESHEFSTTMTLKEEQKAAASEFIGNFKDANRKRLAEDNGDISLKRGDNKKKKKKTKA